MFFCSKKSERFDLMFLLKVSAEHQSVRSYLLSASKADECRSFYQRVLQSVTLPLLVAQCSRTSSAVMVSLVSLDHCSLFRRLFHRHPAHISSYHSILAHFSLSSFLVPWCRLVAWLDPWNHWSWSCRWSLGRWSNHLRQRGFVMDLSLVLLSYPSWIFEPQWRSHHLPFLP